ncbi:MAG: hypothetical protein KatS3mg044_1071 [Rhodothermaceae bacterium]|nr:MAG: hypothetical protein KatS3mg044_1071 [Rhodothermaceae bacterium]
MNDRSKKGNHRATAPENENPAETGAQTSDPTAARKRRGPIHLKSRKSLERLRARVEETARELHRLRAENERLTERIAALESRDPAPRLGLDEDPAVLERKIKGFIEAIDRYLEAEDGPA